MQADVSELAARSPSVAATRAALGPAAAGTWLVGGAVRDLLLDIPVDDVDLAVSGDARAIARALHAELGGDIFSLSDRFGTWRVHAEAGFQLDISPLRGGTITEDLAQRDFTVNAMGAELADWSVEDPHGGRRDLERGMMRLVSEQAYEDDPLRPLRLPRLASVLGFAIDPDTAAVTRRHAARVGRAAPERIFAELRGLIGADTAVDGLRLLEELALTAAVLPELAQLKGVMQSVYHHLDAYEHTLEVLSRLLAIEADGYACFERHAAQLARLLAADLGDELTLAGGLRWAALLHDIAKAETRVEYADGHVGFPGHDERGAVMARGILRRLHAGERLAQYVGALTRHHLRLGFLVDRMPLTRRDIYGYLTAVAPVEVEVGVLTVADRQATRGRKADRAITAHTELAVTLTGEALALRSDPPAPLVRGDELARALGIEPGPQLGRLLAEIAAARFAGEVATPEQAIELARAAL